LTSLTTLLAIIKYMSRLKNAVVKAIDIDIRHGDIDPPLTHSMFQHGRER